METEEKSPPFKTLFPTVLMLATISFVATDIYLPSLPSIQKFMMSSNSLVQLTLTFYMLTFSLSQIFYGPLSDQFGRRKIAIVGLSFSFVGSLLCILSFNIYMLLGGRALQGLALGVGTPLARAVLRDVYSGERLVRIGSFFSIGAAAFMAGAPTLGGYIQKYFGWRSNFLFILLYTLLGLVMIFFWLPETNKHLNPLVTKPRVFIKTYLHLLKNPIFLGYSLCATAALGGLFAYFTASPFLFEDVVGLTPVQYGWLALFVAGGIAFGGYCNTLLIKKIGRHRSLVVGVAVMFLSGIVMLIPALFGVISIISIMFPMFFYCCGAGMTFANSFAGAFQPFPTIAGFAAGLYGCFQIMGGAISSAIIAFLHERNQIPLSIFLIAVGLLAYFLQLIAFKASVQEKFPK